MTFFLQKVQIFYLCVNDIQQQIKTITRRTIRKTFVVEPLIVLLFRTVLLVVSWKIGSVRLIVSGSLSPVLLSWESFCSHSIFKTITNDRIMKIFIIIVFILVFALFDLINFYALHRVLTNVSASFTFSIHFPPIIT